MPVDKTISRVEEILAGSNDHPFVTHTDRAPFHASPEERSVKRPEISLGDVALTAGKIIAVAPVSPVLAVAACIQSRRQTD